MITVKGLTRKYGDFTAVRDVSFTIPAGQVVGLLGHNGAGKTTIMKMLTGYLEPTEGTAEIDGLDVVEQRLQVQQKIGYLPEVSPLYPDMTVLEYLDYVCALRGIPDDRREEALRRAITRTGLREAGVKRISTLSKGYKQRLGVAQAIIHEPEILVLDEPTSGLDPSQIHEMRELLRQLASHSTVIISTHILQEVEAMCDRVIIILNGRLAADANLEDLRGSNHILLHVDRPHAEVEGKLQHTEGVVRVTALAGKEGQESRRYLIETRGEPATIVPLVARTAVMEGWQVFHIGEQHKTLDAVFRDINAGGADARE